MSTMMPLREHPSLQDQPDILEGLLRRYTEVGAWHWLCERNDATGGRPPSDWIRNGKADEVAALIAALPLGTPPWKATPQPPPIVVTAEQMANGYFDTPQNRAAKHANSKITARWRTR